MKWNIAFLLLSLLPATASAHGVHLSAKFDADKVYVSVEFDDDTPMAGARIRILNAANETVAEAKSDGQGRAELPRPPDGDYTVEANDGAGHRKTIRLSIRTESGNANVFEPNRWMMLIVGLALIAGISWLLRRWVGRVESSKPADS